MISDAGGPLNFNCRHPAFLIVVHQLGSDTFVSAENGGSTSD